MKLFILKNWYKLLIATAVILFSISCLVFALKYNTVKAGVANPPLIINKNSEEKLWVVGCGNYIYEVTYNKFHEKYECKIIGPAQDY